MLLGKLRVRGKLGILVATPLVMVMILVTLVSSDQFGRARQAAGTAQTVEVATEAGVVVAELQQERLISVGYLLGVATSSDVAQASATVGDEVADVTDEIGDEMPAAVRDAMDQVTGLDTLRAQVLSRQLAPDVVITAFSDIITPLLDSLRLADGVDASTVAGREVLALDALVRVDELNARAAADLVAAAGGKSSQSIMAYSADRATAAGILNQFTTYATSEQINLYGLVGKAFTDRIGWTFDDSFAASPASTMAGESAAILYPKLTSFVQLGRFVETKIAADVMSAVTSRKNTALLTAYSTVGLALLMVVLITWLGIAVARAVAGPLARLTVTANRVARIASKELERVADDDSDTPEPIRLETVQVTSLDEVGDVARAFERVQTTAARLLERQMQSRRNVAEMLGHIGRRTQNLVGRQIAVIDGLESQEADGARLAELYRLDHIASRLRRHASSLVVLSGAAESGGHFAPLPLADAVRLALGEIEAYTRVDIDIPSSIMMAPAIINDLVLLLAELMENATAFSPPHTRVAVSASLERRRVTIVDHGIGLSDERIDEENRRIAQRERLDLVPTEVLGLFVVGRLARRHGLRVVLSPTDGGGLTVHVDLGAHLLTGVTDRIELPSAERPGTVRAIARVNASSLVRAVAGPVALDAAGTGPTTVDQAEDLAARDLAVADLTAIRAGIEDAELVDDSDGARAVGAAPLALADVPFNLPSLDRAMSALEATPPWQAFELPQPALPSAPFLAPPVSAPAASAAPVSVPPVSPPPVPSAPVSPPPVPSVPPAPVSPPPVPSVPVSPPPVPAAPVSPPPVSEPPLPAPATWPFIPPPDPKVAPDPEPVEPPFSFEVPLAAGLAAAAPDTPSMPDAPPAPLPSRARLVGGLPLARRVPGATTRDEISVPVSQPAHPRLNASEARDLIEQFEYGVAQALRDAEAELETSASRPGPAAAFGHRLPKPGEPGETEDAR